MKFNSGKISIILMLSGVLLLDAALILVSLNSKSSVISDISYYSILTASSFLLLSIITGIIAVIMKTERKLGITSIIFSLLVLLAMAAFIGMIAYIYS